MANNNDTIPITTCPVNENFKFKGKCQIKTCQYNSPTREPGCMKVMRKEGSGRITDAELCLYKHPDKTPRYSGAIRKKALLRVKNIAALYKYVLWIQDNYNENQGLNYVPEVSNHIDRSLEEYPLNIPALGFKPWILKFLLVPEVFNSFILDNLHFKNSDINLKNMLDLPPKKISKLLADVNSMSSKSFQNNRNSKLL